MIAFFELECPHTAPEEAILLVGGDGVIGNWDLHGAVMMETSAQRFPWWVTSGPLVFDSEVEFQFAISDRSSQNVRWESLPFKRRLAKVPRHKDGRVLEVVFRASWDDAKSTVSVRPSKIARAHELQEAALESAEADVLRERSRSREREPVPLPGMPAPRRGPGVTEPEAMARSTRRSSPSIPQEVDGQLQSSRRIAGAHRRGVADGGNAADVETAHGSAAQRAEGRRSCPSFPQDEHLHGARPAGSHRRGVADGGGNAGADVETAGWSTGQRTEGRRSCPSFPQDDEHLHGSRRPAGAHRRGVADGSNSGAEIGETAGWSTGGAGAGASRPRGGASSAGVAAAAATVASAVERMERAAERARTEASRHGAGAAIKGRALPSGRRSVPTPPSAASARGALASQPDRRPIREDRHEDGRKIESVDRHSGARRPASGVGSPTQRSRDVGESVEVSLGRPVPGPGLGSSPSSLSTASRAPGPKGPAFARGSGSGPGLPRPPGLAAAPHREVLDASAARFNAGSRTPPAATGTASARREWLDREESEVSWGELSGSEGDALAPEELASSGSLRHAVATLAKQFEKGGSSNVIEAVSRHSPMARAPVAVAIRRAPFKAYPKAASPAAASARSGAGGARGAFGTSASDLGKRGGRDFERDGKSIESVDRHPSGAGSGELHARRVVESPEVGVRHGPGIGTPAEFSKRNAKEPAHDRREDGHRSIESVDRHSPGVARRSAERIAGRDVPGEQPSSEASVRGPGSIGTQPAEFPKRNTKESADDRREDGRSIIESVDRHPSGAREPRRPAKAVSSARGPIAAGPVAGTAGTFSPLARSRSDVPVRDRDAEVRHCADLPAELPKDRLADISQPERPLDRGSDTEPGSDVSWGETSGSEGEADIPVVLAASELLPWSNSGGLGRVVASLARQFALRGRKTMTVVPMYTRPPPEEGFKYIGSAWVRLDKSDQEVRCMHKYVSYGDGKGCDHVLLDHGCYQHRPHGLYCDSRTGQDYGDNLYRFAMLSLAALEVALRINFGGLPFGQRVMFLSHDWQAGLLPVYLAHQYRRAGVYREARTLHVIHNLGYQGKFPASRAAVHTLLGLEEPAGQDLHQDADLNICKAAVLCADRVVTVSPSYAREIQTPQGGCGLEEVLSQKQRMLRLAGIRNALDDDWDPSSDKHIVRRYNQESFLAGRKECKAALQKKLGLSVSPRAVLFGFVGRLTWQKGVDVLVRVAPWLLTAGLAPQAAPSTGPRAQIVIMGEGEQQYKHLVQDLEMRNRRAVCGLTGFDPVLEHQMMAGCDFILMPSRYEPCGLPQMAACTYGALPIATCTGGLKDSVRGVQQERPTGFLIQPPLSESSLRQALRDAMMLYFQSPGRFQQMQRNAMAQDFRWGPAIDEYEHQMRLALVSPPQR
ncbi:unnamed protein product [Effrenium voratum]|uniref:starch synthase n=1 Tax=Effrenium voratum TaxID=2562239 RepID=A0AA36NEX8_9DINO|nr:unnamed protein product [Effrenium voratum]